jgi:phosphomannomutase
VTAHAFDPSILRAYDIRGVVGVTLSADDARAVGRTFGTRIRGDGGATVCVGYDGRISSPDLEAALSDGLSACGLEVIRVGLGPTPMLNYSVFEYGADGGVMVTGSHNPPDHNGFKLMLGQRPFFGDDLQALGEAARAGSYADGSGSVREQPAFEDYVARLARDVEVPAGIVAAWDAGNGATGDVLGALVQRLPGRHILLHETIDGRFPAHHPDPTVADNLVDLQNAVRTNSCDLGLAFDGDGDRIGVIDGKARILWGDQLLAILARDVLAAAPGATIIADVKASDMLFDEVAALGGEPLIWCAGHSLIKAKMVETGSPLAGEMSGHIFFADEYYGFDDALYAGLRLLRVLARTGKSLAELFDSLPVTVNTPEIRMPCDDARKFGVITEVRDRLRANGATFTDVDGVRVRTGDGWWLLRASNTEGALVVRCESSDEAGLARLKDAVAGELRQCGVAPPAF